MGIAPPRVKIASRSAQEAVADAGIGVDQAHRALRLGTRDALKLFHRGMIERCLGRPAAAKSTFRAALDINPHFSPRWSPVAKEAVR